MFFLSLSVISVAVVAFLLIDCYRQKQLRKAKLRRDERQLQLAMEAMRELINHLQHSTVFLEMLDEEYARRFDRGNYSSIPWQKEGF